MHLLIDGYGGDLAKMWDVELVRRFLEDYPSTLGMNRISEAQAFTYTGPNDEDSGVSGFVVIAESHISIHTFPHRNYVNVDVFSCRSFDNQRALEDVKKLFSLKEVRIWLLDRGLDHVENRQVPSLQASAGSSP